MGGDKKTETTVDQTSTQRLDPASQAYVDQLRQQALDAQGVVDASGPLFQGPNETWTQGVDTLRGIASGESIVSAMERLGLDKPISGASVGFKPTEMDISRISEFFNPYEQRVIDALGTDKERALQQAVSMGAREATKAGAFGGSRAGILQSEAYGGVERDFSRLIAETRQRGYEQAQNMAFGEWSQMQNLGMQGAIAQAGFKNAAQIAGLQSRTQLGALGLQQMLGAGEGLLGAGEAERRMAERQAGENIYKEQLKQQMGQAGLGPTGQDVSTQGTTTTVEHTPFNPFTAVVGAGATLLAGPLGASLFAPKAAQS